MSTAAVGAKTVSQIIAEVTAGTLPATPAMKVLPLESNTLKLSKGSLTDNSIRGDRMGGDVRPGMNKIDGDIKFNYRCTEFDELLENMFMGAWTTNVLKAASTVKSHAMEIGHTDVNQYSQFLGLRANTLDISAKPGDLIKCTMTFMGMSKTDYAGTTAAQSSAMYTKEPFDSFNGSIQEGGSASAIITGFDIKMSNNLAESTVLFNANRTGITAGNVSVSGSITAQFIDAVLFNKFKNGTNSAISITLTDPAGKSHTILIPKIVYTDSDLSIANESELTLTLTFNGQYDSTTGTKIQITRVP
jgi:hypothetical protein